MGRIQLEVQADDPTIAALKAEIGDDEVIQAKPDHFEGDINVVNLLVQLTVSTIPIVGALIVQHIRAKRFIKVKLNGIEIRGENLKSIEAFLKNTALPAGAISKDPRKKAAKKSKRSSKSAKPK
jgi:hypothetical protein